ncbi:MAG: ubiquinone/menaquinone biosynthesis C-methylase UbiE [Parasphingorhabdus sp.]|jgi:ubiquinone/menaquinone biosynthesis C-methylase UbiE
MTVNITDFTPIATSISSSVALATAKLGEPRKSHSRFVGSIPKIYDTHLGPLLFEFAAADLAKRVAKAIPHGGKVLEVACGTGILTEHLSRALPPASEIIATDLNEAMLDFARQRRGNLSNVTYQQADALELPFSDASFDIVVCQFGLIFFPDKAKSIAEMTRVLRPGGLLTFNVWDCLNQNIVAKIALETIAGFFETDPPGFLSVPFGYYDIDVIRDLLLDAGYGATSANVVSATVERPNALYPAMGFVEGNPGILQIRERAIADLEEIIAALAQAYDAAFGPAPLSFPLQEIIFSAVKP